METWLRHRIHNFICARNATRGHSTYANQAFIWQIVPDKRGPRLMFLLAITTQLAPSMLACLQWRGAIPRQIGCRRRVRQLCRFPYSARIVRIV